MYQARRSRSPEVCVLSPPTVEREKLSEAEDPLSSDWLSDLAAPERGTPMATRTAITPISVSEIHTGAFRLFELCGCCGDSDGGACASTLRALVFPGSAAAFAAFALFRLVSLHRPLVGSDRHCAIRLERKLQRLVAIAITSLACFSSCCLSVRFSALRAAATKGAFHLIRPLGCTARDARQAHRSSGGKSWQALGCSGARWRVSADRWQCAEQRP